MRSRHPIPLIVLLLTAGFFQPGTAVSASQKVSQITRYPDVKRSLTANEMMLIQFQRERNELMKKGQTKEKNARLLKNRLKILNGKIEYLERQIKFEKPRPVSKTVVKPIAKKPVAEPAAVKPAVAPKPIAVKWKGYAPQAERKRHFLAWTPNVASLKPEAASASRSAAFQAEVPVKAATPLVEAPVAVIVPQTIDPQPPLALAPRGEAATRVVPLKVAPQAVAEPAIRESFQQQEMPPAPKKGSKAHGPKTGADWMEMAREDKEIYILSIMGNLSRRDVYLMKPYNYYIDSVDRAVESNPLLEEELVHRILMMSAYESEPDTRKDLEKVWK